MPYPEKIPGSFRKLIRSLPTRQALALYRQFRPSLKELKNIAGYGNDPLYEETLSKGRNFVHKYPDRLLYLATEECAVLCRYCTRKRKTFASSKNKTGVLEALQYVKDHTEISEVVFSGGDPFLLKAEEVYSQVNAFARLKHIRKIRFHSRIPTVLPQKINERMLGILEKLRRDLKHISFTLVCHINHACELHDEARNLIFKIQSFGWSVKNQTVLLKNTNDDKETLQTLFYALLQNRIEPYYLHQLDRIAGASHFEVEKEKGLKLMETLQNELVGCALPLYVEDGKDGKKPILRRHRNFLKHLP